MNPPAAISIDPTTATFVLAILVLIAGVYLTTKAMSANSDSTAQQAFAAVGVLFGLLAAGGLGGLFANSVAQDAADSSANQAAQAATQGVSQEITQLSQQVESFAEPGGAGGGGGE